MGLVPKLMIPSIWTFSSGFNKTVDVFGLFKAMSIYRYEPVTYLIAIFSSFSQTAPLSFISILCLFGFM